MIDVSCIYSSDNNTFIGIRLTKDGVKLELSKVEVKRIIKAYTNCVEIEKDLKGLSK